MLDSNKYVYVAIDQQCFDDELCVSPGTIHILAEHLHSLVLKHMVEDYVSFPRPEDLTVTDKELVKIESALRQSLARRCWTYGRDKEKQSV